MQGVLGNFFAFFYYAKSCVFNGSSGRISYTLPCVSFTLQNSTLNFYFLQKIARFLLKFTGFKRKKTAGFHRLSVFFSFLCCITPYSTKTLPPINSRIIELFGIILSSLITSKNLINLSSLIASAYCGSSGLTSSKIGTAYFLSTDNS